MKEQTIAQQSWLSIQGEIFINIYVISKYALITPKKSIFVDYIELDNKRECE